MDKPPSLRSYFTLTDISTVKVNCLTDRQTDRHQYNGLFSRTTWASRHQKDYTILDFNEAKMTGWQWHQLDHMQIVCTSLQTDNHASTLSFNFFTAWIS